MHIFLHAIVHARVRDRKIERVRGAPNSTRFSHARDGSSVWEFRNNVAVCAGDGGEVAVSVSVVVVVKVVKVVVVDSSVPA